MKLYGMLKKPLMFGVGAAFAVALLAVLFVMPAEFGIDPTGFGAHTGLMNLSAATTTPEKVDTGRAHRYEQPFRCDVIEIELTPAGALDSELEHKVKMRPDATLVYAWTVKGLPAPDQFYFDFHSEERHGDTPAEGEPHVISHEARIGSSAQGSLVAPFEGIHGWYFQNQADNEVKVLLKLSGFYELQAPLLGETRLSSECGAGAV